MPETESRELDQEQAAGDPQKGSKKTFPKKLVLLIAVVLILIGGGAFAWKGGVLDRFHGKMDKTQDAKNGTASEDLDMGPTFPMDPFIVNLLDTHGKRYLKLKMELELNSEEVKPEVELRMPQFKDTILTLLSSKSYQDVSSLEGKFQLRAEMMSMLNQYLQSGTVDNIYFTEFIVQ